MASLKWPSIDQVFTDPALDRLADVWGPIFERHNLDMGRFTIYISAAMVTLPIGADMWKAIQFDRKLAAAAAEGRAPGGVVDQAKASSSSSSAPIVAAATREASSSSSSSSPPAPPAPPAAPPGAPAGVASNAPPDLTRLSTRA